MKYVTKQSHNNFDDSQKLKRFIQQYSNLFSQ